ncbi:hypothetical protein G6011_10201 [Alternaria panax]|uniref:Uncharacterized protein n=1 Tax=Alternaria panax TaxID=48097 RepID=A0AAD4NPI2_9PLEO|nr:hypothetical protein G6011_10201 [Alternaria panax]
MSSTVALDKISTATSRSQSLHPRRSSVGLPTADRERTGSAVLVALQLKANRSAPIAPAVAEPDDQDANFEEPILDKCDTAQQASQEIADHEHHILPASRFPSCEDDCTSKISVPSPHPEESSETASPTSDTTPFEDAPLCSVSPLGCGEGIHAYTAYDDIPRKEMPATCARLVKDYESTPVATSYVRHRRYVSSNPAFDIAETLSTSLRSRAKTDDGLLLFRANSSKEPPVNVYKNRHRYKISLNLPVNPHAVQRNGTQQHQQPGIEGWTQPLAGIEIAHSATIPDMWAAEEERDLEYKHRHTFIGTGSLDELIEILETSTTHTTTKSAVARAFVQLASSEQLYARQCSARNNGWDFVSRTSLAVMDVTSVDYVVQLQVKLGSITLRQFMDLIHFDEVDEASAMRVVEAFSVASHMDATAGIRTGSKAKAFRRWMVEQMKADAGH